MSLGSTIYGTRFVKALLANRVLDVNLQNRVSNILIVVFCVVVHASRPIRNYNNAYLHFRKDTQHCWLRAAINTWTL